MRQRFEKGQFMLTLLRSVLFVYGLILAAPAGATEWLDLVAADGTKIKYAVDLPPDFDPEKTYPALLALPPGGQNRRMIEWAQTSYWGPEAAKRNFIVVAPIAPYRKFFFDGGEVYLPELLDTILATYHVEGGRFHVAGISNGGLSAFRAAMTYPERFRSVTVLAGFVPKLKDTDSLNALRGIRISMFVGADDTPWLKRMNDLKSRFDKIGISVFYEVVPDNGHEITDLADGNAHRVFDHIRD